MNQRMLLWVQPFQIELGGMLEFTGRHVESSPITFVTGRTATALPSIERFALEAALLQVLPLSPLAASNCSSDGKEAAVSLPFSNPIPDEFQRSYMKYTSY